MQNLVHHEQFIAGIGYQDGYDRDTSVPEKMWALWSQDERLLYQKACLYGSYQRLRKDAKKLGGLWLVSVFVFTTTSESVTTQSAAT